MKISFQIPSQLVEFHRAMDYDPRGQYFSFDILRIKYLSVSEFSCSAASRCIKLYQMIMFYHSTCSFSFVEEARKEFSSVFSTYRSILFIQTVKRQIVRIIEI